MNHLILTLTSLLLAPMAALHAAGFPLTLHPKAQKLPFTHQGPFVTKAGGGVLCVDAQNALSSADEGRTWTSTPVFREASKFNISNERALLRTRDGVVIAAWMNGAEKKTPPGWNWGVKGVDWQDFVLPTYVCRSLDDGKTWEEPVLLGRPWCGCIHSMIETSSGRIVLVGQEIIPQWRHATVNFVSDDKGRTWQRSNMLDYGVGAHDHAGSIEGTVVERKDGSLYLLLRTESGFLWEAASRDGGLKWAGLQQSQIKSVTCCPQMTRLADGRIALLWNHPPRHRPDSRTSREELSLAFSSDECATWSKPVVVAASYGGGARVSYPYLYERKPGELWITTMQGGLRMKVNVAGLGQAEIPVFQPPAASLPKEGGIVMFGDSTTAERPGAVDKVYAARVSEMLQSIGSSLSVHNAGTPGNTTREARKRFERDVLAHKPRVVVIQFGLNDAAVDVWKTPPASAPRVPLAEYEQNLRWMLDTLRTQKAKPVLMTTNPLRWTSKLRDLYGKPPYRPDDADGFDAPVLARYNEAVRQLAKELAVPLVEIHDLFAGKNADQLLLDGMHPNDAGHELIAAQLMPVIRAQIR
ncbi:MAG: exo-alpha-sialidase [Verrucomicrobia bacterium]|nr:exo-alpha-sialidase [Verrucomicrobiota bacterium]